ERIRQSTNPAAQQKLQSSSAEWSAAAQYCVCVDFVDLQDPHSTRTRALRGGCRCGRYIDANVYIRLRFPCHAVARRWRPRVGPVAASRRRGPSSRVVLCRRGCGCGGTCTWGRGGRACSKVRGGEKECTAVDEMSAASEMQSPTRASGASPSFDMGTPSPVAAEPSSRFVEPVADANAGLPRDARVKSPADAHGPYHHNDHHGRGAPRGFEDDLEVTRALADGCARAVARAESPETIAPHEPSPHRRWSNEWHPRKKLERSQHMDPAQKGEKGTGACACAGTGAQEGCARGGQGEHGRPVKPEDRLTHILDGICRSSVSDKPPPLELPVNGDVEKAERPSARGAPSGSDGGTGRSRAKGEGMPLSMTSPSFSFTV
ncbi:hypothetical protein DFH09DRAFT_1491032, partial [Mycena vulgaris]